jgi:XTP/dITP diphosphohydrolase
MPKLRQLVLGTHNRKKGVELAALVRSLPCEVKTLADFPKAIEVVEDGNSFAANARLKASKQAVHLGVWVLGEDSGLEVESLGGAPGIYSARYAGPDATDDQNNRKLLAELDGLPPARRGARYVCHAALADPAGEIRAESEDYCYGRIRTEPAGEHGFGYDPLFEIVEYHRTFGQLGPAVKRCLSHRSRAIRHLVPSLRKLIESGGWPEPE